MNADDDRLAKASRALRREQQKTQRDLAIGGRSREFVLRLESGGAGALRLDDIRDHFEALGARVRVSAWWNEAALDRLLDARHAELVETTIGILRSHGWRTEAEVTFSEFGERGSIDVMAGHECSRSIFIGEVKTAWGSIEETNRRLDAKARLGPALALQRFGWRPAAVARVLVMPEDRTLRRTAARHAQTMASVNPARGREVRAWLRSPALNLRALWFLSEVAAERP